LPTRIYALAKDLKIENKKLVDICNQIGITGKGSALASLSDDEVVAIKAYLEKTKAARPAAGSTAAGSRLAAPVRREEYIPPAGTPPKKVPVLEPRRPVPLPGKRGTAAAPPAPPAPGPEAPSPAPGQAVVSPQPATPATVETVTTPESPLAPVVEVGPPPEPAPVATELAASVAAPPVVSPPEERAVTGGAVIEAPAAAVVETPVEPAITPLPEALSPAEPPALSEVSTVLAAPGEPVAAGHVAEAAALATAPVAEAPFEAPPVGPGDIQPPPVQQTPSPAATPPPPIFPPIAGTVPPTAPIPVLPSRGPGRRTARPKEGAGGKAGTRGPAIRVAPIPTPQKPLPVKPAEPPPQKPEIKLAPELIRATKLGLKPLSEHLKKQEEKRKAQQAKKSPVKDRVEPEAELPADLIGPVKEKDKERRKGSRGILEADLEEDSKLTLGGREQRQLKRKRAAASRVEVVEEEEPRPVVPTTLRRQRRGIISTAAPRKSQLVVELPCTVRSFSEAVGVSASQVMAKLLELGAPAVITATIEPEVAELLAESLGLEVQFRQPVSAEDKLLQAAEQPDDPATLRPRPPVVTFLGHVDHGKTSLLDRILGLDVAAHEKGGITQHIRAYRIEKDGRPIAFVDTPGHEAFTAMRARGAMVTDIAVLVVAADDGVMPQTEEAINHAKAAGVPIIVALNKIDLPGINPDRILQQLATAGLLPSQWGGDVEVVPTSAVTGQGVDTLLDTILTVAELHEYRANPDRPAVGVCLEAELQPGRGVVAKMIVQKGTLHVGDVVVCGAAHGRVKAMYDTLQPHKKYKEAGPATPVNLTGLDVAPAAGDRFYVVDDISLARQVAQERALRNRRQELAGVRPHVTLENLFERLSERQEVQTLHIILRADVRGSIEAIQKELSKLQHPEVRIEILQAMVGGITEADVHLADASDAIIIGFNVAPDEKARSLAEQLGVQIRRYDIIYQVSEDLKAALEGMLKPEKRETDLGRALVKQIFHISRVGTVAGCQVLAGTVQRDCRVRVIRDGRVIGDYPVESLRREKEDVREVRQGYECGMKLAGFNDVKEGDILEAYRVEEIRRTL